MSQSVFNWQFPFVFYNFNVCVSRRLSPLSFICRHWFVLYCNQWWLWSVVEEGHISHVKIDIQFFFSILNIYALLSLVTTDTCFVCMTSEKAFPLLQTQFSKLHWPKHLNWLCKQQSPVPQSKLFRFLWTLKDLAKKQIMHNSLNYASLTQLCAKLFTRIIPLSLSQTQQWSKLPV